MNILSSVGRRLAGGLAVISVASASVAFACDQDLPFARFVNNTHPDHPMAMFANGHLGIIQPGFSTTQLAWAWRTLQFGPGDANERQKMVETWRGELHLNPQAQDPIALWESTYKRVTGQEAPPLTIWGQSGDSAFSNCTPSAIRGAIVAIQERKAKRPTEVKVFTENQARVFSACSERSAEGLVPPPNGSSDQAIDDYRYQQAAFDFYTQDYKSARLKFLAITKNKNSPWAGAARISAARCLIRSATLKRDTPDLLQLETADTELNEIIKDSSMKDWQSAAWQLVSFCRVRTQPTEWLAFLVQQLGVKSPKVPLLTVVQDIAWLSADHPMPESPFGAWFRSMTKPKERSLPQDALARFKKDQTEVQLIAALQESDANSPDALIDTAFEVPATSPAYLHASYHAARLAILKGKPEQAIVRINLLMADKSLPPSARNMLANLRLPYEQNWSQLWNDAVKIQVGSDGANDFGAAQEAKGTKRAWGFDTYGSEALQSIPTVVLLQLAQAEPHPELKRFLALTAWTRAIILHQDETSLSAAKMLLPLDATLARDLQTWAIQPVDRAHYEGVLLMAKLPGLSPIPTPYWPITVDSKLSDSGAFASNGWCGIGSLGGDSRLKYPQFTHQFLQPASEVTNGPREEFNALRALPASPAYLAQEMVAWAAAAPADERVPEGLAAAVKSSRWGCRTAGQADVQRAFQLLQKKYGKTKWAQQTPEFW